MWIAAGMVDKMAEEQFPEPPIGLPWFIHTIKRIYDPSCRAGLPDGTWPLAVAEPYTAGSLKAAWWVLKGRAFAFAWPKPGDLEDAAGVKRPRRLSADQQLVEKNARNSRVQARYDELMREGKHGHYETMFRVVREEIERDRETRA